MKKNYILDTNILIQSPEALFGFEDNNVFLTGTTLQELDKLKDSATEAKYNAIKVNKIIEELGDGKSLNCYVKGVPLKSGGKLFVEPNGVTNNNLPAGYSIEKPDNRIISACLSLQEKHKGEQTILVTNDVSMRTNARICGLQAEGYRNEQAGYEHVYKGKREIYLSDEQIDYLYRNKEIRTEEEYTENEYLIVKGEKKSALAKYSNGSICLIKNKNIQAFGISPKNISTQYFAMDALLNPNIDLVVLQGPAGSAKTFLSIACGLEQSSLYGFASRDSLYNNIMITRANVLSDRDIGYLPGSKEEKMEPLIAPFKDNLKAIFRIRGDEADTVQRHIDDLFETYSIEIESIAFMRGRSISNTYLIVDEAQNTTPGQIKEIITRAGEGTKVIICGDPEQIDSPKLDRYNNGLVYAAERMKGLPNVAQLVFDGQKDSVRSRLAAEAAKRL